VRAVIFDNEAVQALASPDHPKHRRVLAHLHAAASRRGKGREVTLVVPATVRVEAGWDRRQPAAATINRLRIVDHPLATAEANIAAAIVRAGTATSVADAHVGTTVLSSTAEEIVVLTSDPRDIARVCDSVTVHVVTL
jgi:hypothetical protein